MSHHHHHGHNQPDKRSDISPELRRLFGHIVDYLDAHFDNIERNQKMASQDMTDLLREVSETRTAVDSIIVFNAGLAQRLLDNAEDAAAVRSIAGELNTMQGDIATSILNQTPVVPNPTP